MGWIFNHMIFRIQTNLLFNITPFIWKVYIPHIINFDFENNYSQPITWNYYTKVILFMKPTSSNQLLVYSWWRCFIILVVKKPSATIQDITIHRVIQVITLYLGIIVFLSLAFYLGAPHLCQLSNSYNYHLISVRGDFLYFQCL